MRSGDRWTGSVGFPVHSLLIPVSQGFGVSDNFNSFDRLGIGRMERNGPYRVSCVLYPRTGGNPFSRKTENWL